MKTIGLLGGMSWESSAAYYRIINEAVRDRLGGFHSAKVLLYSVDFAPIEAWQRSGDWDSAAQVLAQAAQSLERAGAELLLLCTNTQHRSAGQIQAAVSVPLLHIGDATAAALLAAGIKKAALLGTKYTMTQDFLTERLRSHGIEPVLPEPEDMDRVDRIIFQELCLGKVLDSSRRELVRIAGALQAQGAEGLILGCTELDLLLRQEDVPLPLFDTTRLHALAAVDLALEELEE